MTDRIQDGKAALTLQGLGVLSEVAQRNGTESAFIGVAMQWAGEAQKEVIRLRAEVAEWREKAKVWMASPEAQKQLDGYRELAATLAAKEAEAERLQAEVESLRRDAERYRWLRDREGLCLRSDSTRWKRPDGTMFIATHYLAEGGTQHASADGLDATIDAAISTKDSK
jgi:hypothetical protein